MLVAAGGGGSISVDPAVLHTMAGQVMTVASGTGSCRGSMSGAASAAAGCAEPAAGAFGLMQSLISGALSCLDDCAISLSRATSAAATAYETTDATQVPMSIQACPAVP
jgi:hypothetical protein